MLITDEVYTWSILTLIFIGIILFILKRWQMATRQQQARKMTAKRVKTTKEKIYN